jgi:predicted HD superfamily hydrolase involved in NAD metabolism
VDIAERLNEHLNLGLDEEQVLTAALLHDYAKYVPENELAAIIKKEYQGDMRAKILKCRPVWHAFACPYYIRRDFKITDADIIDAVTYHTTAKKDMSELTSLIFVSDYIEEGRTHKMAAVAREAAFENLEKGVLAVLQYTIDYVEQTHSVLFEDTMDIYKYYKERVK